MAFLWVVGEVVFFLAGLPMGCFPPCVPFENAQRMAEGTNIAGSGLNVAVQGA